MQAKEITEAIKSYMQCDAIGLQALVLYGEWGSGKTYYCENDLKAALKDIDVKTCRVSLFGVSDYDEICKRVLASRLHIYENAKDRVGTAMNVFKKSAIEAGTSALSNKLADLGIQVSVNSDLMLSLIDMTKVLVILDDCERSSFAHDDRSFLGFVNNMVENYGWHVMLVRNQPLSFEDDCSVEKAVISQIEYEPDLQVLYRAIVKDQLSIPKQIDFKVKDAVIDGLKDSLINARALSRSIPCINYVLSSSALIDESIDLHGRVKAFSDFVGYAVQASAGIVPNEPKDANSSMSIFDESELQEYDYYLTLSKALAPLTEGKDVDPETVKSSFNKFVLEKNPNSAADVEAQEMEYHWGALRSMEDGQVELLANHLKNMLAKGQYSQVWFYKIIRHSLDLIILGFWDDSFRENLLDSLRLAANHDPKCDAAALRQERANINDFYGTDANLIMDKLITEVEQDERERDLNRISLEFSKVDQSTGKTISAFFEEAIKSEYQNRILNVPAETVAKSTYEGTADSQNSLHSFFHTGMKRYTDKHSLNEAIEWLKMIDTQLVKVGSKSRMGGLRTKWIRNDIKQAIATLNERAQNISTDSDVYM
ncbi:P-loop NTPase fold protein [Obesumbacterium proteus]|uniref:P-loop NTPase fold protein n=1 Tax=Obesumbacterium proteus TaxID=82983 RepID=UPI002430FBD1|nr:P-loop NTPase fold protein [Obesumbacterium proteus]